MYRKFLLYLSLMLLLTDFVRGQEADTQRFTFSMHQISLHEALERIRKQTSYSFAYNPRRINLQKKIDIQVKDVSLQDLMEKLAKASGTAFRIIGKQIVLTETGKVERMTVSGFIRDVRTGESLPGATVYIPDLQTGTACNSAGFYSLSLPRGDYELTFSSLGYIPQTQTVRTTQNTVCNVRLKTNIAQLNTVVIHAGNTQSALQHLHAGTLQVNPESLTAMPDIGGEGDLVKSMQSLPGIQVYSDGSAFFYVRGGNRDQNLILLDDSPIYNPAHLFGFYSVIVPDVIKGMSIYKSGFPVETETRLSSIIELQTKDGNYYRPVFHAVLHPLIYRFSVEGPLVKEKSSYYLSFRHSNFRWLYHAKSPNTNIYLYDLNAKINLQLTRKDRIYLSLFAGKDWVAPNKNSSVRWDNRLVSLRWDHILNTKLFFRLVSNISSYEYQLGLGKYRWTSGIKSLRIKAMLNYFMRPWVRINGGYSLVFQEFAPGTFNNDYFRAITQRLSRENALFISSKIDLTTRWQLEAGLRMPVWQDYGGKYFFRFDAQHHLQDTVFTKPDKAYFTSVKMDPRIGITYQTGTHSAFRFSYGYYHQYVNLITHSTSPFTAFEVWLPAGQNIPPQAASQWTLGWSRLFPERGIECNIELYYKQLYHQILYKDHAQLLLNPLIEGELRQGKALAKGIEISLQKKRGTFTGRLNYTFSHTALQSPEVNGGKAFVPFYDRPHDFSVFLQWNSSPRFRISANFIYYTGSAITTPVAFYNYHNQQVPVYGDKNNDRLPDYHRLDIAFYWRLNKKDDNRYRHSLSLSFFNVYNHRNPISVNYNKVKTQNGKYVIPANYYRDNTYLTTGMSLLGIFPSLTYKFSIR